MSGISLVQQILFIVLPVFLVIWTGALLKYIGLIGDELVRDANRLIYFAALPALLFYKIARADFSTSFNPAALFGLAFSIAVCFAFSFSWGYVKRYPPALHGAFTQAATRGNLAYVALAVIASAYGESGVARAGIMLGFIVPAMSVLSIFALILPYRSQDHGVSYRAILKEITCNPMFIGPVLGIIWSYFRLPLPEVIATSLQIFSSLSLPLALLCIGAAFSFTKFRGEFSVAILATTIKIILLPILSVIVLYFLGVGGEDLAVTVLLAGAPTATVAYILAHQLRGDADLSAMVIMLSTLLSVITYTIFLYLIHFFGSPI